MEIRNQNINKLVVSVFLLLSFFGGLAQAQTPAVSIAITEAAVTNPDVGITAGQYVITISNISNQDLMGLKLTMDSMVALAEGHDGIQIGLLSADESRTVNADFQLVMSPEMTMGQAVWRVEYSTTDGATHDEIVTSIHHMN